MTIHGPIFISHSTVDRDDVQELCETLREALRNKVRTFSTSASAIEPGVRWRDRILNAIKDSSMVVLWATPNALESQEVAFEVGASFAYERPLIPCCVHVPPSRLPWSLSEIQALTLLDKQDGWLQLADTIANKLDLSVSIDKAPLLRLASRFQATSTALEVEAIGVTIEFRNTSSSAIRDIRVKPIGGEPELPWTSALEGVVIGGGKSVLLMRGAELEQHRVELAWIDVIGVNHSREVGIPPARISEEPATNAGSAE